MNGSGSTRHSVWSSAVVLALAFAVGAVAQHPTDASQSDPAQAGAGYELPQAEPATDPPSRVARLSVAQGSVSVEPASVDQFSPAEVNYPLTTGDRVWTGGDSLAELEAGQIAVRLGATTDLTVTAMTDSLAQFGLGQGSVHLATYALGDGTTELDTPNVAITVQAAGDVRVNVDPVGQFTDVRVFSGVVEVDGDGLQQTLGAGQAARFAGLHSVSMQWLQARVSDALDDFAKQRDQAYEAGEAAEQNYLSMDTVGGADLDQSGIWLPEADYGTVWFPAGVPAGWQPYCYGRWTWVAPWGWTWIETEPWGFAPFHYGRWAQFGGRWGWVPGPPVVHPVYAPALVVFVHPGNRVSAWFPLGPNEPYAPWYHSSPLYLNRVNVSNLYSRNLNQVRTVYNTANRQVYANALASDRRFVNRAAATVAVPQDSLANGKPVRQSMMRLPEQQVAGAPVLPHPMVSPERMMVAPTAARALPPRVGRPTVTSRADTTIANQQQRGPQTVGTPTQGQPAPIERRGYPGAQGDQAGERGNANQAAGAQLQTQPNRPAYRNNPATGGQSNQPNQQTIQQNGMTIQGAVLPPNPARGTERLPGGSAPVPRGQMPNGTGQEQLYNRAVPPPARPNFEQQRQAIQSTDPGRPLSPQQLDNLRQNRPVGQPEMREAAPHPAPAPPPPQRSSPPAAQTRSAARH